MAAHQLCFFSINFKLSNTIHHLERKSSSTSQQTRNSKVLKLPVHCKGKALLSDVVPSQNQIIRRSANFQPSTWNDDYIQSLNSGYMEESYKKQARVLKEEIKLMLREVGNHADKLEMIDLLQRLGVSYHFNNEINNILENVYNNMHTLKRKKSLHATSLAFRLLRQHGYNISPDVFASFQDEMCNFKTSLYGDIKGLLSLYEASAFSMEDEPILDEAKYFSSIFLKEFVNKNSGDETSLVINYALKFPLQWRVPRLEALWFIKFLCKRRQNVSHDALLQFAELDFNIVQSIHQHELKSTSRWWKRMGFVEELGFFRDRLVENFFVSVGMNFTPNLENLRKVITKVACFLTMIDDIYDSYGTLEELQLFTEAICSWDLNAMDSLPHYMKMCFLALYNLINDIAFSTLKETGKNIIPFLRKLWADYVKANLFDAKWYYSGYTPSLQEYMENACITVASPLMLMHAYVLIPNNPFTKEDLDCMVEDFPSIIRCSTIIFRLHDDLKSYKREMETGEVSTSIQCYMAETGASEADSAEHIRCMIHAAMKKMNEAALNSPLPRSFIDIVINFTRSFMFFYQNESDGYTAKDQETKRCIESLFFQPIPVTLSH